MNNDLKKNNLITKSFIHFFENINENHNKSFCTHSFASPIEDKYNLNTCPFSKGIVLTTVSLNSKLNKILRTFIPLYSAFSIQYDDRTFQDIDHFEDFSYDHIEDVFTKISNSTNSHNVILENKCVYSIELNKIYVLLPLRFVVETSIQNDLIHCCCVSPSECLQKIQIYHDTSLNIFFSRIRTIIQNITKCVANMTQQLHKSEKPIEKLEILEELEKEYHHYKLTPIGKKDYSMELLSSHSLSLKCNPFHTKLFTDTEQNTQYEEKCLDECLAKYFDWMKKNINDKKTEQYEKFQEYIYFRSRQDTNDPPDIKMFLLKTCFHIWIQYQHSMDSNPLEDTVPECVNNTSSESHSNHQLINEIHDKKDIVLEFYQNLSTYLQNQNTELREEMEEMFKEIEHIAYTALEKLSILQRDIQFLIDAESDLILDIKPHFMVLDELKKSLSTSTFKLVLFQLKAKHKQLKQRKHNASLNFP